MEKFAKTIKKEIKKYLPEEYVDSKVVVTEVLKINNNNYMGLCVLKPDNTVAAYQNLNAYHEEYLEGKDMESILKEIAQAVCTEKKGIIIETSVYTDYEKAKENLIIKVIGINNNENLLKEIPYIQIEDLAITYHLLIEKKSGLSTAKVTNKFMEIWEVSLDELHRAALQNAATLLPACHFNMNQIIKETCADLFQDSFDVSDEAAAITDNIPFGDETPMKILTNDTRINGAAVIFYPGVMEKMAVEMGGSYYILPSSMHEMILLPENTAMTVAELKEMVTDINSAVVASDERLSNQVYHYDVREMKFSLADTLIGSEIIAEELRSKNSY